MKTFDATSDQKTYKIVDIDDWDAFDAAITSTAVNYRGLVGYTIYLANDLDFSGAVKDPLGKGTSKGVADSFAGSFDGQGHTIKNLTIRPQDSFEAIGLCMGLFGKVMPALENPIEIKNLIIDKTVVFDLTTTVTGTDISSLLAGKNKSSGVGALIGTVDSGYGDTATTAEAVGNLKVKNILNFANVSGNGVASGGLIANVYGCTLEVRNCTNAGDIFLTDTSPSSAAHNNTAGIGGVIGALGIRGKSFGAYVSATVANCRNSGNITINTLSSRTNVPTMVGGIVGATHKPTAETDGYVSRILTISNCINNGNISYAGSSSTTACKFGAIYGDSTWDTNTVADCTNYGILTTTNATAATVKTDDCESKAGSLDFTYNTTAQYYQLSKTANAGKYSLRLVALHNDIEAYDSFGYEIVISYKTTVEGQETTKTVKATLDGLTTVNTSIAADNGMGAMLVSATELGGEYVSAVRIDNIPTAYGTLTVTITPKMTAKGATEPTLGTPITFTVTPNYN